MIKTTQTQQIQSAIILPVNLTKQLDKFVKLGIGDSRETLTGLALDAFITMTEGHLERKKHVLAIQPELESGSPEWEASFQKLEEIAMQARTLSDEEMDELIGETVATVRNEKSLEVT
ncbi:MAG TPA: hypothetical protein G4N96_10305 [Chloroflexi bacterium]|nr:hypothetical protein [Chloroflexota bacterium]